MRLSDFEYKGEGANGRVFRCRDELGRDLAVKFFTNSFDPFSQQVHGHADVLKQINHRNVVRIIAIERLKHPEKDPDAPEEAALVMEFVNGVRFTEWKHDPKLELEDIRKFGLGLLDGLAEFHRRGLAHLDLHAGNIYVEQGEAKLLDPLAQDPSLILVTAEVRDRCRRDVRDAEHLLRDVISRLPNAKNRLEHFMNAPRPIESLENLRAVFTQALQESAIATPVNSQAEIYERLRDCQSKSDMVAWQELRKRILREFPRRLEASRKGVEGQIRNAEQAAAQMSISLGASDELIAMILAAAEFPQPMSRRAFEDISLCVESSWPREGNTPFVRVPDCLVFAITHYAVATTLINRNAGSAIDVLSQWIHRPYESPKRIVEESSLIGWPKTFGGDCTIAWRWLVRSYSATPVLAKVFSSDAEFKLGLHLANFFTYLWKLAEAFASNPSETQKVGRPGIPPSWLRVPGEHRARMWQIISDSSVGDPLRGSLGAKLAEFRAAWPRFHQGAVDFWNHRIDVEEAEDWPSVSPL